MLCRIFTLRDIVQNVYCMLCRNSAVCLVCCTEQCLYVWCVVWNICSVWYIVGNIWCMFGMLCKTFCLLYVWYVVQNRLLYVVWNILLYVVQNICCVLGMFGKASSWPLVFAILWRKQIHYFHTFNKTYKVFLQSFISSSLLSRCIYFCTSEHLQGFILMIFSCHGLSSHNFIQKTVSLFVLF